MEILYTFDSYLLIYLANELSEFIVEEEKEVNQIGIPKYRKRGELQ